MKNQQTINIPVLYEIRVAGHLSEKWVSRFEGLTIQHDPDGETALNGLLDQAALHGVFVKIRDLGLYLISVNQLKEVNPERSLS